jgi:hypothetical protein
VLAPLEGVATVTVAAIHGRPTIERVARPVDVVDHLVSAVAAVHQVVPAVAVDLIVAIAAADQVSAGASDQRAVVSGVPE